MLSLLFAILLHKLLGWIITVTVKRNIPFLSPFNFFGDTVFPKTYLCFAKNYKSFDQCETCKSWCSYVLSWSCLFVQEFRWGCACNSMNLGELFCVKFAFNKQQLLLPRKTRVANHPGTRPLGVNATPKVHAAPLSCFALSNPNWTPCAGALRLQLCIVISTFTLRFAWLCRVRMPAAGFFLPTAEIVNIFVAEFLTQLFCLSGTLLSCIVQTHITKHSSTNGHFPKQAFFSFHERNVGFRRISTHCLVRQWS